MAQDSWSLVQDLNPEPPEYNSNVVAFAVAPAAGLLLLFVVAVAIAVAAVLLLFVVVVAVAVAAAVLLFFVVVNAE